MKYIVLIYQPENFDPKAISEEDNKRIGEEYQRLTSMPNVQPGAQLGKYQEARLFTMDEGSPSIEALPLEDRGDIVSAFWTVEVESDDELVELLRQIPAAKMGGRIEVRPPAIYW